MLLADVAAASRVASATRSRTAKVAALADCLRRAGPDEVPVVVAYLSGELPQRRTGVGPAALRELPAPVEQPGLRVLEVDAALDRIAGLTGTGSQRGRSEAVVALFSRATRDEQRLLGGLLTGELRQGALEGLMGEAVAVASGVPLAAVRRAAMLGGGLRPVAAAVLVGGEAALAQFRLEVGRPVQPMLASPGDDVASALARTGTAAVDWKLDGVRVQLHRAGADVAVFTRSLEDVTARVPDVVEAVLGLDVRAAVLDGEAIGLRADGRPRRFQETGSRVGSQVDVARARAAVPLSTYVFDVLHIDGADVLDEAAADRFGLLADRVPGPLRVPRVVTDDLTTAQAFYDDAVARGHEGVVVKDLDTPYEAGRRGAGWLKVKPRHTLDLVVLAAEWGHGRRRGWLSNLHLGARDPETGGYVMLGNTFKGLTDAMLDWQTARLNELADDSGEWVVHVRPELVVEVAFDGVQTSPRYPAGVALRFARVLRYRPDKRPDEADTVQTVLTIHARSD